MHWSGGCAGAGDWTLGKEDAAQQVPFTAVQATVATPKCMRNLPDSPDELHKPQHGQKCCILRHSVEALNSRATAENLTQRTTHRADTRPRAAEGQPYCAEARNVEGVVGLLTEPVEETLIRDSLLCVAACSWGGLWG